MLTGQQIIDFIKNCELENAVLSRGSCQDTLMFEIDHEFDPVTKKYYYAYMCIDVQAGTYFTSTTTNESYICRKEKPE